MAQMLRHLLIEDQSLKERIALFEEAEQRRIALENLELVRVRLGVPVKEAKARREQAQQREAAARISPAPQQRPPSSGPRMSL